MKLILYIGIAGFFGSIARYLLALLIQTKFTGPLPVGTLSVNIIGCLFAGFLLGISDRLVLSNELKTIIAVGFIGGFTTYSAFTIETITLLRNGHVILPLTYLTLSIVLGFVAAYSGFVVSRTI